VSSCGLLGPLKATSWGQLFWTLPLDLAVNRIGDCGRPCNFWGMATPTEEILAAIQAAIQANLAAGGVSGFRENEDSATFHSPSQYASLIRTLANDEVQATLDNAGKAPQPVFRYVC